MSTSWFWPPSGLSARGVACVPYGAGLLVPDWTTPRCFPFTPGVGFGAPIVLASGTLGVGSATPDGSGGVWMTTYGATSWHLSSGGVAVSGLLNAAKAYVGSAFAAGSGFSLASDGGVWKGSGSAYGTWPAPAIALTSSGTTLAALLPASGLVALMSATTAATGSIALPVAVAVPSCMSLSTGAVSVAVGGWQVAPTLSGAVAAAADPQNADDVLAVGSGFALLWGNANPLTENWAQTQTLSGLTNLTALAWRPDGTQTLAASPASGVVQVVGYSVGTLSLAQTLSVSGACSVAVAGTSTNALVAQSGMSQAATLTYGSSWSVGTPVTGLTGITAIASVGSAGAVAAVSGGVAILGLAAGAWSMLQSVALGFTPTAIGVDPFGQVYAAGSGALVVLSGATVLGSGSWTGGAPTSIAVQQGRVVMAVPTDGLFRLFGESSPGAWTQQGSASLSLGASVGLALSETVLFAMGSGATRTYGFSGTPYVLTPVTSGVLSLWNGSSWTTTALGIGHNPSALTFDASGNVALVTAQDTIWSITASGGVVSSGTVPVFSGQVSTTTMGASSVAAASGHTYVSTSLAGVLVETS